MILPDTATLMIFVAAALALLLTPGPAVLYIVARSVHQGRRAGLVSALGLTAGGLVHVAAAALGVSAILMSSALAFQTVKQLGAVYLVYLGIRTLLKRDAKQEGDRKQAASMPKVFSEAVIVNLLNPKAALFFLAFLPQFVDPARGPVAVQFVSLGIIFTTLGFTTDTLYALLAGTVGGWLRSSPRMLRMQRYLTGGTYIGLGVATAFGASPKK